VNLDAPKKLTIAHIMPWNGGGGTETAVLRMTAVTREQFRHVAFCLPDAESLRLSFNDLGIETVTYSAPEPSLRHGRLFYKQSLAVAKQLRAAGADIVHFAELKAAYHTSFAARLAGCRLVCHVRNTYPHIGLRERIAFLPVHTFIFVSNQARRNFAISLPDNLAPVIYDAIDMPIEDIAACSSSVRLELGIPADCTLVGMVARVNPQKDYFTLASAAADVIRKHPDTRFIIVGDNSQVDLNREHYAQVAARLQELGITRNFIFTGHRTDVSRLIAAMDISILSTHREGFGLCIAESMAMRKPVVATAVGGLLEVVKHGVTGYLHSHENSTELASEISALIENPDEAAKLANAGYDHVRLSYSPQAFSRQLANVYSGLMNK
jgi:glycosyltransferase involved in cell wall biosynthesis